MSKELNIKSSTIEKGIEIAKDFLDKLIMPAVEETGLLVKDQVTFWKFKNQVKILNKAKKYCQKHNIKPKAISLKLLVPLIETAALEEDELLQNQWAILLSNLVDSEQNIENHVFPYLLGQISKNEFLFLLKTLSNKETRISELKDQIIQINCQMNDFSKSTIKPIQQEISLSIENGNEPSSDKTMTLLKRKAEFDKFLSTLKFRKIHLKHMVKHSNEIIPANELKEFELSNLTRLGLIMLVQDFRTQTQPIEIPQQQQNIGDKLKVDVEVEIEVKTDHILTELGELFIKACSEKE